MNKFTFYQGTTGGGVWKTEDGGLNWANVSDGFFKTGSVGAIAVAPSNPNVVYVGMGEACFRGNALYGDMTQGKMIADFTEAIVFGDWNSFQVPIAEIAKATGLKLDALAKVDTMGKAKAILLNSAEDVHLGGDR